MIAEGVTDVVVGADEARKLDFADAVNIIVCILRNPPKKNTKNSKNYEKKLDEK